MGCIVNNSEFVPLPVIGVPFDDMLKKAREGAFECTLSLCKAMEDAGGSISRADFDKMSLMDFITNVAAQNNIRFVFVKPNIKSGVDNFGCHLGS